MSERLSCCAPAYFGGSWRHQGSCRRAANQKLTVEERDELAAKKVHPAGANLGHDADVERFRDHDEHTADDRHQEKADQAGIRDILGW